MLQLQRKNRLKNGLICLASMFPFRAMVLTLSKKVHFFCNFELILARNLILLKQFIYTHLKDIAVHFHKTVLLVML